MGSLKRGIAAVSLGSLLLGLLVACGGGGGSFAGIDRLGVTTGTITGFGSIIVNGVRYETTGQTEYEIDDGPGGQDDLRVGQQVTIRWDSTDDGVTRRSQSVRYQDNVKGPIASIDVPGQSLVVLGQVVLVDPATLLGPGISPADITGLVPGQFIRVSGLLDANRAIRATRIDLLNPGGDDYEVRGIVESLDVLTDTFVINGLTVDYSQATNPPALANGQFVEVEGDTFDSGSGTLFADKVEIEDDDLPGGDDGDDGEVEGYITRFVSPTDFDVAGVRITTNAQTRFEGGAVLDLALNVKVEVEGAFNSSGVLVAAEVEFEDDDSDDDDDDDDD